MRLQALAERADYLAAEVELSKLMAVLSDGDERKIVSAAPLGAERSIRRPAKQRGNHRNAVKISRESLKT